MKKVFICLVALSLTLISGPVWATDTLVVSQNTPAKTMHPLAAYMVTEIAIFCNIFDPLVDRAPNGKLIPALAESWEWTTPTTMRFHLRHDVKWQTGTSFTADDVIFTFEGIGRTEINRHKFVMDNIKVVEKIDDYTVDFHLTKKWPVLLDALTIIYIMSKDFCEGKDDAWLAEHPMGTNAYAFKEWVRGSHLNLEAFDECWRGAPKIKKVAFKPIANDAARITGLVTGAVHLTNVVPIENLKMVENSKTAKIISREGPKIIFFTFKLDDPDFPTYKKEVRQAILMGINYDQIAEKLLQGMVKVSAQLPAPVMRGYDETLVRPAYNPEGAKELLAKAGYPDGFKVTLNVLRDRYIMDNEIGVAVAQQLSKIGIEVNVIAKPASIHFQERRERKHDFSMTGWTDNTFDTARIIKRNLIDQLRCPDEAFNQAVEDADAIADLKKRDEALKKINRYVLDNALAIPLHYEPHIYGISKKVKGFVPQATARIKLSTMYFED